MCSSLLIPRVVEWESLSRWKDDDQCIKSSLNFSDRRTVRSFTVQCVSTTIIALQGYVFSNMRGRIGFLGLESDGKCGPTGRNTLFRILHMGALGNISWALILIGGDVNTPLACHGEIKAKTLSIYFHPEEVQALATRSKVVGLFGCIQVCFFRVKKAIKDVGLILLRNAHAIIRDVECDFLMFLFNLYANRPPIRCVFHCIPEEPLHYIQQDEGIDEDKQIVFAFHTKANISVAR